MRSAGAGRGREGGIPEGASVWTVGALARATRELLEAQFGAVWVRGEISNFRRHGSGHCYFTLKDDRAQLPAVLFRGAAANAPAELRDGMAVLVFGEVTVYEAQGKCQIVVRRIVAHGAGALQARFEAMKRRLGEEGLFEAGRKRPLPEFPEVVAVVTSPTGAALKDMLAVLGRRAPQVRVRIFPVRVQGDLAPGEIVAALETLGRWHRAGVFRPDVVIVARGGGSLEDLWAFNEEAVARALAACPVPTVSGVGHEVDFTIADFVADLRAPTPSAAAELLVADRVDLLSGVSGAWERCCRAIRRTVEGARERVGRLVQSPAFREPIRVVRMLEQRTDELVDRSGRALEHALAVKRHGLEVATAALSEHAPARAIALLDSRLCGLAGRLELLDPVRTIARGFAVLQDAEGRIVRSVRGVRPGDAVVARLADGILRGRVEGVEGSGGGLGTAPGADSDRRGR
ncbi:MAG TPA: exodeoxyribonuclease VII large subunit [Verrucomicrobiae bacterium]|nr:exodeoxyribonuclease VII large subunit [Verrucomicrobiae bacterium]